MPRACFLLDHFWGERSGGAEWQTFVLCRALREAGWEVHYVAESLSGKTGATTEAHGIVVHWLPRLQWRSRVHPSQRQLFQQTWHIVSGLRPDVLYSRGNNCFTGMGFCHRFRAAHPQTRQVWGAAAEWEINRQFYRARLRDYYRKSWWKRGLLWLDATVKDRDHAAEIATADAVVVQTGDQQRLVQERFGRDAVVLPSSHEVPAEDFPKAVPPRVVFVAHIGRRKRVELFVELARRLQGQDVVFQVIGDFTDPSYESEIREAARGVRNVEFTGPLSGPHTNRRIAEASLLVSTTDPGREGYPNVFIQAWLRRTPVVSLGFDPDRVLRDHPFLGLCASSVEELPLLVGRLLASDDLPRMGEQARRWAIERHGYVVNRPRIVALFEGLAKVGKVC